MKSSAAAKTQMQDAHPWWLCLISLTGMSWVQRKIRVGGLGPQEYLSLVLLGKRRRDGLVLGGVRAWPEGGPIGDFERV